EAEDVAFGKSRRVGRRPQRLRRRDTGLANITARPKGRRPVGGAPLLAVAVAGGFAVAMHKTLTLSVDGSPMTVSTMKSRVIDVLRGQGFTVAHTHTLYPS